VKFNDARGVAGKVEREGVCATTYKAEARATKTERVERAIVATKGGRRERWGV
jgi:hypothetical protein